VGEAAASETPAIASREPHQAARLLRSSDLNASGASLQAHAADEFLHIDAVAAVWRCQPTTG